MHVLPILHIPLGCTIKLLILPTDVDRGISTSNACNTIVLTSCGVHQKEIHYSYMTLHVGWVGCNFNCIFTFKSSMCCRSRVGWVGCNFNHIFTFKSMCHRSLPSRMKHFSLVIHVIPHIPISWDCAPKENPLHYTPSLCKISGVQFQLHLHIQVTCIADLTLPGWIISLKYSM